MHILFRKNRQRITAGSLKQIINKDAGFDNVQYYMSSIISIVERQLYHTRCVKLRINVYIRAVNLVDIDLHHQYNIAALGLHVCMPGG